MCPLFNGQHRKVLLILTNFNPPYAQSKSDGELQELYFVKQMLDCLVPGAVGIAIVPMSCAIAPNPVRSKNKKQK